MENKSYYPLRLSPDHKKIITNAQEVYGCLVVDSDAGGFAVADIYYSHDAVDVAKQMIEAYNEKYEPKPELEFTPEQVQEMMAKQPIKWSRDYSTEGIMVQLHQILNKGDFDRTPNIPSSEKIIDAMKYLDEFLATKMKSDKTEELVRPIIITDADLISTALQEGSITVAQAIQLHEVADTPGFKNLFIQMQYESKGGKLEYKFNKKLIDKIEKELLPNDKTSTWINQELMDFTKVFGQFCDNDDNVIQIQEAAKLMVEAILSGHKLLSCGNGGSYSDAQHFASELSGKYRGVRPAIAAIALSDGGAMSCIANDFGYAHVFERQIEAIGKSGDVLLCLSTSGNSENVIKAAKRAKEIGITTVGICGNSGGELKKHLDIMIEVPHSGDAGKIQEVTIIVIHILVGLIEKGIS